MYGYSRKVTTMPTNLSIKYIEYNKTEKEVKINTSKLRLHIEQLLLKSTWGLSRTALSQPKL